MATIKCSAAGDPRPALPEWRRARVLLAPCHAAELGSYAALPRRLLALLAALIPAVALTQERVLGLVEVPALHSSVNSERSEESAGSIALRREPSLTAPIAVVINDIRQLEWREHDYDNASATVYELVYPPGEGAWLRLRYNTSTQSGFGWLKLEGSERYRLVSALIREHVMAYFTDDWDGLLLKEPANEASASTIAKTRQRVDVRLIDTYYVGRDPWYLVAVVEGNCEPAPIKVLQIGWVPAYSATGKNTVWYYSRGC